MTLPQPPDHVCADCLVAWFDRTRMSACWVCHRLCDRGPYGVLFRIVARTRPSVERQVVTA